MTRPEFQKQRIMRQYGELRALDAGLYAECVHAAEGVGINHKSLDKLDNAERLSLLADIEQHLVAIALRGRGQR